MGMGASKKLILAMFAILVLLMAGAALNLSCDDDDDDDDDSDPSDEDDDDLADDDDDNNDDNGDDDDGADDDDDNTAGPSVIGTTTGECKNGYKYYPGYPESVEFDYSQEVLTVIHINGVFNCCLEEITSTVTVAGSVIDLFEQEVTPDPCNCICPYDVVTQIQNLESGGYTVNVYTNGTNTVSGNTSIP